MNTSPVKGDVYFLHTAGKAVELVLEALKGFLEKLPVNRQAAGGQLGQGEHTVQYARYLVKGPGGVPLRNGRGRLRGISAFGGCLIVCKGHGRILHVRGALGPR